MKNKDCFLTKEEKDELVNLYNYYYNHELIQKMKEIPMHRGSNCFIHSFKVAKLAIKKALRRKKKLDYKSILLASILHDYYLYDWRKDKSLLKNHATNHPTLASNNAKADFAINDDVSKIILSHMWPYNFKVFPKSIEARIVLVADKNVATIEALSFKASKERRIEKTIKKIENLFD